MNLRENEWLNNEVRQLRSESKRKPKISHYDMKVFSICIAFCTYMFFFASTPIDACHNYEFVCLGYGEASWVCKVCHKFNNSCVSDWKGDHYCGNCHTRMGDE